VTSEDLLERGRHRLVGRPHARYRAQLHHRALPHVPTAEIDDSL
jgi:hypothetical protein